MEDEQPIRSASERASIRLRQTDVEEQSETNYETIANSKKMWKAIALSVVCIAVALTAAVMLGVFNLKVSLNIRKSDFTNLTNQSIQQPKPISKQKKHRGVHSFNLWDYTYEEKKQLLAMRRQESHQNRSIDNFSEIVYDKDEQMSFFFAEFEKNITVVNWSELPMSQSKWKQYNQTYTKLLAKRRQRYRDFDTDMRMRYKDKDEYVNWDNHLKGIRKSQIYDFMMYATMTGEVIDDFPHLKALYEKEKAYVNEKYNASAYKEELTACIIVPSYQNEVNERYMWNLESLFQQEYSNYRVIIMVDLSVDNTVNLIAEHLRWRNVPKEKYILVSGKTRNTALPNLYYASNKFCKHGEYLGFVDGDDELIGTQVYKVYNAMYRSTRAYVVYSQYLVYNQKFDRGSQFSLGVSQDYPDHIKKYTQYREYSHHYSQFRTIFSDIFFMIRKESLSTQTGQIFWSVYDNAIFYPAMDLARQRVEYLPDVFYWYNIETGINYGNTPIEKQRGSPDKLISMTKHYTSIDRQLEKFVDRLNETEESP